MYIDEVRALADGDLANQLEDLKEALFNLRFQRAFNQLEDANAIRRTRRDIARVKMVLRERELAVQAANSGTAGSTAAGATAATGEG